MTHILLYILIYAYTRNYVCTLLICIQVAQYVSPNGNIIQGRGIQPDLPLPTLNAYINMLAPSALTKPDLNKLDFNKVDSLINTCEVSKSEKGGI